MHGLAAAAQSARDEAPFGAPNPKAPAELSQLAFIIGEWKLETWFARPDGSRRTATAYMTARYTLNGYGVRIEERHPQDGRSDFVGERTFVFNKRLGKWIGSGINTLGNRKDLEAEFTDGKLIVTQSGMLFQGRPGVNRATYYDISANGFKNRFDHSSDGGKSWREGEYGFTAVRIR